MGNLVKLNLLNTYNQMTWYTSKNNYTNITLFVFYFIIKSLNEYKLNWWGK